MFFFFHKISKYNVTLEVFIFFSSKGGLKNGLLNNALTYLLHATIKCLGSNILYANQAIYSYLLFSK